MEDPRRDHDGQRESRCAIELLWVDPTNDLHTLRMLTYLFVLNMLRMFASAVLFAAAYSMFRHRSQRANSVPGSVREWDVLVRKSSVAALPARGAPFRPATAFAYATFFHYFIPLWWYRWGLPRTLALLAAPFAATFVLTALGIILGKSLGGHVSGDDGFLIGACVQVPMRVAFGIYVGKRDADFRRKAYFSRGWLGVGAGIQARSASEAIESYKFPEGKATRLSFRERFDKFLSAFRRTVQICNGR